MDVTKCRWLIEDKKLQFDVYDGFTVMEIMQKIFVPALVIVLNIPSSFYLVTILNLLDYIIQELKNLSFQVKVVIEIFFLLLPWCSITVKYIEK